jgi:glycosyltransferase involved in cell wall biosynthesis
MSRLRILTWHVHGNYLLYMSQSRHDFYLPVAEDRGNGYGGRGTTFPFGPNVHDVPADEVRRRSFDIVLYQSRAHYAEDRFRLLSAEQRRLPSVYLEHDPPRQHPTDEQHPVDDPEVLLVHVTRFNELMWDSGRTPTCVIEHGVLVPSGARYTGELARGLTVVNELPRRGRRVGADVVATVRDEVPLDLVGIGSEAAGGLGEISPPDLPRFMARYRLLFNPIRYTSLGLAVCEAMAVGLPVVGLATTEMATVVENGVSGYVDTSVPALVERMHELLAHPAEARRLGDNARRLAEERFGIDRFVNDWDNALRLVAGSRRGSDFAGLPGVGE